MLPQEALGFLLNQWGWLEVTHSWNPPVLDAPMDES